MRAPTRREILGSGALAGLAWFMAQVVGHRPLADRPSPFLGPSARHTLEAAVEAMIPEPAAAAGIVADIDAFLAAGDPVLGEQLRLALGVLEHLGGAGALSFTRFSRLDRARRAEVLESWRLSRWGLKRQIYRGVRSTTFFAWFSRPETWPSIGYDGPLVGR